MMDCKFIPEDAGPIPVIFFAFGNSGSSITWNVMSNLTGHENIAYEKVQNKSQFLEEIVNDPSVTHNWAKEGLCRIQNRQYQASKKMKTHGIGIAGFQWKPNPVSLKNEYGVQTLKRIAKQQKHNPSVRVVVLTRNFLDVLHSRLKHKQGKVGDGKEIPAHCPVGDEECIKMHTKHERSIVFPTGDELLRQVRNDIDHSNRLTQLLDKLMIDYVEVAYEKLYNGDSAEEWMRIFKHLGRGPSEELTMEEVTSAMGLSRTHQADKSETVSNYWKVRKTLKGTKYKHLLSTWK